MDTRTFVVVLAITLGICHAAPEERIVNNRLEVTRILRDHFSNNYAGFGACRHPLRGIPARQSMLEYIKNQVGVLQTKAKQQEIRASVEEDVYWTDVYYNGVDHNVTATNLLFILHPANDDTLGKDEPLVLLANYDTDENGNFVDDGSGVAALLTLAEILIQEIGLSPATNEPRARIERSIIFAFTDVAFKKYMDKRHSVRGVTGATRMATHWLPAYLADRKGFHGAIVLDNIMNYNAMARTQIVEGLGYDRSFPTAYNQMAEREFAGDFLALVHREDRLDTPIVEKLEKYWQSASFEPRDVSVPLQSRLLRFTFTSEMSDVHPIVNALLNMEQSAFWNHHIERKAKMFPAVTLTDTRLYRRTDCQNMCRVSNMLTEENLSFMKHTINTLKNVVINMQTDKSGALPTVHGSSTALLTASAILAYVTSRAFL